MPRNSNFFQEAMTLCRDNDPYVSRLTESLYRKMLEEFQQHGLSPLGEFNILYFMQAVIHVWLSQHPAYEFGETKFPIPCERISGINWPEMSPGRNAMAREFVEVVKRDSDPRGDDFDVAYAVRIIELLFDDNGDLRSYGRSPSNEEVFDFDDWLSGFNSDQS